MQDLISVVIPIYNVEKYLRECVDSVLAQTYRNIEIILVDDGSEDGCPEICDSYAAKNSVIKVIHKENGGLSDARNAGVREALGEYIYFLDSDDVIDENTLELLYNAAEKYSADISECNVYYFDGLCIKPFFSSDAAVYDNKNQIMQAYIKDKTINTVVWNKLYKAKLVRAVPFEKGKYNEDEFFTYLVLDKADRLVHISDFCCYYRQRCDSIMGSDFSLKRLDSVEGMARRVLFIKEHYPKLYFYALQNLTVACMLTYKTLLLNRNADPDGVGRKLLKSYLKQFRWDFANFRMADAKLRLRLIGCFVNIDLFERFDIMRDYRRAVASENETALRFRKTKDYSEDTVKGMISIVVAVYNSDEFLGACIDSLLQQTYRNIEVILVDDGATDNCPRICDEYAKRDSRVRVIHKPNGGTADARNAGIFSSKGEYIWFIDGDDLIAPDTLEKMHAAFTEYDVDIAECNVYKYYEEDSGVRKVPFYTNDSAFYGDNHRVMEAYIKDSAIKTVVWNKLYKRSVISDIPFIKGTRNEDEYYTYRVLANTEKLVHIDDFFCCYRQRVNSLTSGGFSPVKLDTVYGIVRRAHFVREFYPDLYYYDLRTVTYAFLNSYKNLVKNKKVDADGRYRRKIKRDMKQFRWSLRNFIKADTKLKLRLIVSHISIGLWARMEILLKEHILKKKYSGCEM